MKSQKRSAECRVASPKQRISFPLFTRPSVLVLLVVSLLLSLLVSCSTRVGRNNPTDTGKTEKGTYARDREYQIGDVRLEDGIEYIYVKNRKFGVTPQEPECVWVRKDEYSPRLFEGLQTAS